MINTDYKERSLKSCYLRVLILLLFAAAILGIYWQVAGFDFVSFDDPIYVKNNYHVSQGLTIQSISWAFTTVYGSNWHPLTWISHMLDVQFFGLKPGMHHFINVILHILNTILLFYVLQKMTGVLWRSAVVAGLFAFHPLHVESVAWISERKDLLSTFFWILTMINYLWYVQHRSIQRYLVVVFFFILGLMSKPMVVTLPFVLLLLDFWPLNRLNTVQMRYNGNTQGRGTAGYRGFLSRLFTPIFEKILLIALAMAASVVTFSAQQSGGSVSSLEKLQIASRLANAVTSYAAYLGKAIWPLNLAVFYPFPATFNSLEVILSILFIFAITGLVLIYARILPYLVVGWLWYLGTLIPVIGIVQVGSQSMADRYTYIPLVGIFIMVVWGFADLLSRRHHGKVILCAASTTILALLMAMTWVQVSFWKNSETLFRHALDVTKNNFLAHNSLGVALFDRGDMDGAIKHYWQAINIKPNYINAHCNLGIALAKEKKYGEAFAQYRECLRIDPTYCEAHYNIGVALSEMGKINEAIEEYRRALHIDPNHANAHNNLGVLLADRGQINKAIDHYQLAIQESPAFMKARMNLVEALTKKGRIEEAMFQMNEALKIEPGSPALYTSLAALFIKENKPGEAVAAYEKALSINPVYSHALYGLAVAYASQGRYDQGLVLLNKMGDMKPDDAYVDYNIACLYSMQGRIEDAVTSLKQAVNKGFKDWDTLKNDPDLTNIRNTEYYRKTINSKH